MSRVTKKDVEVVVRAIEGGLVDDILREYASNPNYGWDAFRPRVDEAFSRLLGKKFEPYNLAIRDEHPELFDAVDARYRLVQ